MRPAGISTSYGFGSKLTLLGKRLLLLYGIIYVVELLFEHWLQIPLVETLQLYPFKDWNFQIWQFFTHPFLHNPRSPLNFLISCLVFYFFASPVENAFGSRRFLVLFYFAALGGALCGLGFSSVAGFNVPFLGMTPSILALVVIFGLLNPEATILLMFILPIKAKYLSYGTVLITFLTFLAKANPHGAYHLGGILFGYLYFKGLLNFLEPRLLYLKFLEWQLKKKRARFKVVDGKKSDTENDEQQTYH